MKKIIFFFNFLFLFFCIYSQNSDSPNTYPDETGFKRRMAPMIEKIAAQDFAKRSLAFSKCPDTGLPVYSWALEGEVIYSPFTGRAYKQGPTGYFGPKARNADGEIIAFGGDPLKKELPPATAALLLNPNNVQARAFLSIPGNMRQQYHFACKNWARFYPLFGKEMGEKWNGEFYNWIGTYTESRRPSDGYRESLPLSTPHNLVGEPGELLGGNPKDGGTENHKTMWRTSALLYSQLFPDSVLISGYTVQEAERLTKEMIRDYLKRILITGNGEYDSRVYYPHSIEAFLNLYDFSPDEETRKLAEFALDYYFSTYGMKVIDGAVAGAQKRGYLPGKEPSEMEIMEWGFFNNSSRDMDEEIASIQQTTTSYRPNKIIWDITRKNLPLPFESKMSRPFYHMDNPGAFAETFYCSESYAMGNIQMTIVDNPNQQVIWSLIAQGTKGPLGFSGGHPMRGSTSGHSPYTQTLQSKSTLILLSAPTEKIDADTLIAPNYAGSERPNLWHLPKDEQGLNYEIRNRQKYGKNDLHKMIYPSGNAPEDYEDFWNKNKGAACSWFYYPSELKPIKMNNHWIIKANKTLIAIIPLTKKSSIIAPEQHLVSKIENSAGKFFENYSLIVFPGMISGYIVETGELSRYGSIEEFSHAIAAKTKLTHNKLKISYYSLNGDNIEMEYFPRGLRCKASINGESMDWDNFTNGAVYESPYIRVKNGIMEVTNGTEGYKVDFTGKDLIIENL